MKDYDWDANPVLTSISEEEAKDHAVITKDFEVREYSYINGFLTEVITIHQKVRVNDDEGVEGNNKVYIRKENNTEVIGLKARCISKDGKVVEFNKDNIKEIENFENAGPYTIFALEGVEKGSEVEYMYTLKSAIFTFNCDSYLLNNFYTVKNAHFELIYDKDLVFLCKSYNGLPEPKYDTTKTGKNRQTVEVNNSPSVDEEDFSYKRSAYKRLEYKYSKSKSDNAGEANTFDDFAKMYFKYFYESPQGDNPSVNKKNAKVFKKEIKAIDKMLKSLALDGLLEEQKIIKLEDYIKSFTLNNQAQKMNIVSVLESKELMPITMCRIFALSLDRLGIEHQMVITNDRSNKRFDGNFESWNFLTHILLYFPKYNKYLTPMEAEYRYGLVPYNYSYNDGIFIRFVSLGELKSPIVRVGYIDGNTEKQTYSNLDIDVTFDADFSGCDLDVTETKAGHEAVYYLFYKKLYSAEKKEEIAKGLLTNVSDDAEVKSFEFDTTQAGGDILKKVFVVKGKVHSSALIEKAGNNYFFEIGKVIGPQAELYEDKERLTDVENTYEHSYTRIIKFTVPEGYQVKNIEDLNMDVFVEKEGVRNMGFTSSYKKEGNVYTVAVYEFYGDIRVPKAEFEPFRKVINAAADFNKKHVVFEKIK